MSNNKMRSDLPCGMTIRAAFDVMLKRTNGQFTNSSFIMFCEGWQAALAQQASELTDMESRKDAAYLERNQVVSALAKCFQSGTSKTVIEGWSEDWHGCVYINLPTGQASWHYHDSQAHLFADLPPYKGVWDGHTTEEKYARLAALAQQVSEPAQFKFPRHPDPESSWVIDYDFLVKVRGLIEDVDFIPCLEGVEGVLRVVEELYPTLSKLEMDNMNIDHKQRRILQAAMSDGEVSQPYAYECRNGSKSELYYASWFKFREVPDNAKPLYLAQPENEALKSENENLMREGASLVLFYPMENERLERENVDLKLRVAELEVYKEKTKAAVLKYVEEVESALRKASK